MQGEDGVAGGGEGEGGVGQLAVEQAEMTLGRRVEVMMGVAVERLQEGDGAEEVATGLEDADEFFGAAEGVADVLEDGDGEDGVEGVVVEGQVFADG